jgi:hypothetical protein
MKKFNWKKILIIAVVFIVGIYIYYYYKNQPVEVLAYPGEYWREKRGQKYATVPPDITTAGGLYSYFRSAQTNPSLSEWRVDWVLKGKPGNGDKAARDLRKWWKRCVDEYNAKTGNSVSYSP